MHKAQTIQSALRTIVVGLGVIILACHALPLRTTRHAVGVPRRHYRSMQPALTVLDTRLNMQIGHLNTNQVSAAIFVDIFHHLG